MSISQIGDAVVGYSLECRELIRRNHRVLLDLVVRDNAVILPRVRGPLESGSRSGLADDTRYQRSV